MQRVGADREREIEQGRQLVDVVLRDRRVDLNRHAFRMQRLQRTQREPMRAGHAAESIVGVAATAPSRLIATREMPVSAILAARRSVTSVPLVASAIRKPVSTP